MENHTSHFDTLLDIETRHEALLKQLDALDKEVASVLQQCQMASRVDVPTETTSK